MGRGNKHRKDRSQKLEDRRWKKTPDFRLFYNLTFFISTLVTKINPYKPNLIYLMKLEAILKIPIAIGIRIR